MIDPNEKIPQRGHPDELDKIIYSLMPDRHGHCDRQRSQNKTVRKWRRDDIIKAVKDLLNANKSAGAGPV